MDLVPLSELFNISRGSKLDYNKMTPCSCTENAVSFVGRSGERNGFVGYVEKLTGKAPYKSGLITVALGGSALSSFVQPRLFYTAQNIDVLAPIVEMSIDVKLYYCLCIEANRFRYSTYGREANRTLKTINIPSLESVPAWVHGASKKSINELSTRLNLIYDAAH
ncbi:MAG: restriction endonuclease subunit S [Gammaproteobacteria bacterium]|nr:restriction endonuclease subunit S [Gammaproteobacteria bacterium]MCY4282051.1 restriction endonuclease subunit S [Gammaproteobacteria bacterium]MCY4338204.1 restriction endonuclease subunit S [Gammaproteobacteria bacterium]